MLALRSSNFSDCWWIFWDKTWSRGLGDLTSGISISVGIFERIHLVYSWTVRTLKYIEISEIIPEQFTIIWRILENLWEYIQLLWIWMEKSNWAIQNTPSANWFPAMFFPDQTWAAPKVSTAPHDHKMINVTIDIPNIYPTYIQHISNMKISAILLDKFSNLPIIQYLAYHHSTPQIFQRTMLLNCWSIEPCLSFSTFWILFAGCKKKNIWVCIKMWYTLSISIEIGNMMLIKLDVGAHNF